MSAPEAGRPALRRREGGEAAWDFPGVERGLAPPADAPGPATAPRARRRLRALVRHPTLAAGLALLAVLALLAWLGPALAPHDPTAVHPESRLAGPGGAFPLGTDHLGRCLLSRLLHGARWSLGPAALALAAIFLVGTAVGAVAGWIGGALDGFAMRVVDVLLAFPLLVPAIAIAGVLGPSVTHVMLAVAAVGWAAYARIVRGLVLAARERPYVEAARALGFGPGRILVRHVLPNVLSPVAVLASVDMGVLLLTMTALGFLGLGAQPPTPEWGAMLAEARAFLLTAPRLMVWPGLLITLTVVACNLVGEGLRDLTDPRTAAR